MTRCSGAIMRAVLCLIPLIFLAATALAFDPIGAATDGVKKLNPLDYSSTTTNPSKPDPIPPEPQSPCDGKTIRPDSAGNFIFTVGPGGAGAYAIEFSKNGLNWNDPINGALGVGQVQGEQIPVNVGKLLLISKVWHWRTVTPAAGKPRVSKRSCKIAIEPSGGAQMLTPPILVSPVCGSQAMGPTVLFDAKPGGGKFAIFRAELQYRSPSGGNWMTSGLLTTLDKNLNKFGMAAPVDELAKHAGKWRWRARLYHEKMPLFGNLSQGEWSPWCEFTVPSKVPSVTFSQPAAPRVAPGLAPPPAGAATPPAGPKRDEMKRR